MDDIEARMASANALLQRWSAPSPLGAPAGGALAVGEAGRAARAEWSLSGSPIAPPSASQQFGGWGATSWAAGVPSLRAGAPAGAPAVTPLSRAFASPPAAHAAALLSAGVSAPPRGTAVAGLTPQDSLAAAAAAAALLGDDPSQSVETAFAAVLTSLASSSPSQDPPKAPSAFARAARCAARLHREAAAQHLHRGQAQQGLLAEAEALEAEATTWALVDQLLGESRRADMEECEREALRNAETPLGGTLQARLRAAARPASCAEEVDQVDSLARLARVVAWLEAEAAGWLGGGSADWEAEGGTGFGTRFAPSDGCWRETRNAVGTTSSASDRADALVTELDFDAPSRQMKLLHPSNAEDERRLHAACFRLLRAGRLPAVHALCVAVGQPWRAASYGAGAGFAPAQVGRAASSALGAESEDAVLDALAAELDGSGCASSRALWKWTCAAAATAAQRSGSPMEAAVYGALAGEARSVLGACGEDWHARAWARARALLDARCDAVVAGGPPFDGCTPGAPLAAPAPVTPSSDHRALASLLPTEPPRWPTAAALQALPRDLAACFGPGEEALGGGGAGSTAAARHRRLQRLLALGDWPALVASVAAWALPEPSCSSAGPEGPSPPPASPLRFGAHFLFSLRQLAPPGAHFADPASRLSTETDALLNAYAQLLCAHHRLPLVPVYAAAVRAPTTRLPTMLTFWTLLSSPSAAEPLALRERCFWEAVDALGMEGQAGVSAVVHRLIAAAMEVVEEATSGPPDAAPHRACARACARAAAGFGGRLRALEWAAFGGEQTAHETALGAALLSSHLGAALCIPGACARDAEQALLRTLRDAAQLFKQLLPPPLLAAAAARSPALGCVAPALVAWGLFFDAEEQAARWRVHHAARLRQGGADQQPAPAETRAAHAALDSALAAATAPEWLRGVWGCSQEEVSAEEGPPAAPDVQLLLRVQHAHDALHAVQHAAAACDGVHVTAVAILEDDDGEDEDQGEGIVQAVAVRLRSADQEIALDAALACLRLEGVSARLVHATPVGLHARLCRSLVVPHLLLRAAAAEAGTLGSLQRTVAAAADPRLRAASLLSPVQLRELLRLARHVELDQLEKQAELEEDDMTA